MSASTCETDVMNPKPDGKRSLRSQRIAHYVLRLPPPTLTPCAGRNPERMSRSHRF